MIIGLLVLILLALVFPGIMRLMGWIILLVIVGSMFQIAKAETNNYKFYDADGRGSYKIISSSEEHQFSGLNFAILDGRVRFFFKASAGYLAFTGVTDLQPSAEEYILMIDGFETVPPSGDPKRIKATGKCIMHMSADGMIIKTVSCASSTIFGPALMFYKGSGKPISISDLK